MLTVEVLRKSRFPLATSYVQVGKELGSGLSKRRLDLEREYGTNVRKAQVNMENEGSGFSPDLKSGVCAAEFYHQINLLAGPAQIINPSC